MWRQIESETVSSKSTPKYASQHEPVILEEKTDGVPAGEKVVSLPDAAEKMGIVVTRVMDMLRNKQLAAVTVNGVRFIPERLFNENGELNKFVPGVLALLSDGGYSVEESLDYLFTEDESLPGRPVDALHGHLAREVMRRTQAMALI